MHCTLKSESSQPVQTMDPNASIGEDDDRNSAVRSARSMRPSSTRALLPPHAPPPPPPPPRHRSDHGDSGGRVSRLRSHDSDDDVTLQSVISQSGERSVQMPREGTGITPYDLAYEGHSGGVEQEAKQEDSQDAVAVCSDDTTTMYPGTDVAYMQSISEAKRRTRPSLEDKKAGARLELASSREPDEDLFVSREVSGSSPLPVHVATRGGMQTSKSPFGDKPTTRHVELAPAREQGPEDLAGRRGAVVSAATVKEQDAANQHDAVVQVHSQRIAPTPLAEDEQQEFTVEDPMEANSSCSRAIGDSTIRYGYTPACQ